MESQTHTESSHFHCQLNVDYIKTINGILKIIQIVFSIIAFGCSVGAHSNSLGWVSFVAITGFIHAIFWFIWHMLVVSGWRWNIIIELIMYAIWTLFFLIAGIVAACFSSGNGAAGAAAAFSFFCMVVWAVDTAFQARHVSVSFTSSQTTTTTTTTTAATSSNPASRFEGNPQY